MPNDAMFPVTSHTEGQGAQKHRVLQVNLTELEHALAPKLAPGEEFIQVDGVSRPATSTPTKGPHRYTIFVPHNDESTLNIGNGPPGGQAGISLDTKSHIHLNAFEGEHATTLALGMAVRPCARRRDEQPRHHRFFAQYQRRDDLGRRQAGVILLQGEEHGTDGRRGDHHLLPERTR